jgi:hypothetical protein
MKRFLLRLLVTLVVLYGLGAVAYGFFRYPAAERPEVKTILADYTSDLAAVFVRREPNEPAPAPPPAPESPPAPRESLGTPGAMDDLRGDLALTLPLAQVVVPGSLDRLPAASAARWAVLKPLHETVLPEAAAQLPRLRGLRGSDPAAFEREREATRARLTKARADLEPMTREEPPFEAAVTLLQVLEAIDAKLAAL